MTSTFWFITVVIIFVCSTALYFFLWYKQMYRKETVHGGVQAEITVGFRPLSEDEYFRLSDGRVLKDLKDLVEALKTMDENTFDDHVSENKNDFADWIKDALKNPILADQIKALLSRTGSLYVGSKFKKNMIKTIERRIKAIAIREEKQRLRLAAKKLKQQTRLEQKTEAAAQPKKREHIKVEPHEKTPKEDTLSETELILRSLGLFSYGEINTLESFLDALKNVDETKFNEYLRDHRMSFDEWMKRTLKDSEMANKLRRCSNKHDIIVVLEDEITHALNLDYQALKKRISALRKKGKGKEVVIPELRLMNIPSKISMVRVTGEKEDLKKVRQLLTSIQGEIEDLERQAEAKPGASQPAAAKEDKPQEEVKQGEPQPEAKKEEPATKEEKNV